MCLEADPNFRQLGLRPWVYEFSNGRRFTQPIPVYGTGVFITDITLVGNSFIGGSGTGTIVGTINVDLTLGIFTGTLSVSGPSASQFQIVGTTLETLGTVPPGSYSIIIVATDGSLLNSPFSSLPFTITGINAVPTADIVTDHVTVGQEQPWHPMSHVRPGLPPQIGRPASIRDYAFTIQEHGRHGHPLPMVLAGSQPVPGTPPGGRRIIITSQEYPAHPGPFPRVWAGNHPRIGQAPSITDVVTPRQEQPWHPQPMVRPGYILQVGLQAVPARFVTTVQEYPPYPLSLYLRGVQPNIGQAPSITDIAMTRQEQPWHPRPHFIPGNSTALSSESQAGTDVPGNASSINASATPGSAGFGQIITITGGGQVAVNSVVIGATTAVTELYYIGSTAFQFGSGAWYGPIIAGDGGTALGFDPHPLVQLSNSTVSGSAPSGTTVGNVTVRVGAGSYSFGYAVTGTNAASFQIVGGVLKTVGTLSSGTYSINIVATNASIIGSPFTLPATITVNAESQDGFSVPTNGASINASTTAGSAGSGNVITIVGGQIAVNGTVIGGAAVTALYYIGHTAFQFGSGAWYAPITAGGTGTGPVAAPQPTVALSNLTVANGVSGATVGAISTATGAGTFSFSYTLSGTNASSFAVSGGNLVTASALAAGSYSVTITATNAAILNGPWSTSFTISAGSNAGVSFPASGFAITSGNENTLAAAANEPGGVPASATAYNFYNNQSWPIWGGFSDGGAPPYLCLQVGCWPTNNSDTSPNWGSGSGFNPNFFCTDSLPLAGYATLADNCAASSSLVSVQIGWEWNSGGAFSNGGAGWDQPGQQAGYIQWWRTVANIFKTRAPNVIRCWAMNSTLMSTGGVPEDFYPGDDVVDAVGMEPYSFNVQHGGQGNVNGSDRTNSFGWMSQMSAATSLGSAHPAKATGSMTLPFGAGGTVAIPSGGKKYVVLAEWQANTNSNSTYVQDVFNWAAGLGGRALVLNYWNSLQQVPANSIILASSNDTGGQGGATGFRSGNQWVAGNLNQTYPHPFPIPRLS